MRIIPLILAPKLFGTKRIKGKAVSHGGFKNTAPAGIAHTDNRLQNAVGNDISRFPADLFPNMRRNRLCIKKRAVHIKNKQLHVFHCPFSGN